MTTTDDRPAGGEFSPDPEKPDPYPAPLDAPSAFREYMASRYEQGDD